VREDGAWIDAGENDTLIVNKLVANKNAMGVFGFSFLDQNKDKVQGSTIGGVAPTFDNIASQKYPVSRSLWFYVKKAHIGKIPGIKEYVQEFVSKKAVGPDGYAIEKGLIPLPAAEFNKYRKAARTFPSLSM
jgi:phosphate transport system substrate-binding protein